MDVKPPLPSRTRSNARRLRENGTEAERLLWFHLRAGRLCGHKFRRPHPLPPYIADFYCRELRLIIELDGSQHDAAKDGYRTSALERAGLTVLRFWDSQVLQETDAVLQAILEVAQSRTLTPTPLPKGEGL